mgnify:CR=1 FL=1
MRNWHNIPISINITTDKSIIGVESINGSTISIAPNMESAPSLEFANKTYEYINHIIAHCHLCMYLSWSMYEYDAGEVGFGVVSVDKIIDQINNDNAHAFYKVFNNMYDDMFIYSANSVIHDVNNIIITNIPQSSSLYCSFIFCFWTRKVSVDNIVCLFASVSIFFFFFVFNIIFYTCLML